LPHPTWIFDLDNTLHDADHGIFPHINALMTRYIMDKLAVNEEAAHALRERYWQQYGATLRGLVEHHAIDPHDFLRETHPTETFRPMLRWEPDLDSVLRALPGRKILLSNGPQHYVEDLLRAGMKTVWLSRKPQRPDYVDARISRISELSRLALAG